MAAATALPPVTIKGAGTFGIVVKPALPNVNEVGETVEFPNMVAKIMRKEENFTAAIHASNSIKETVPALAINFIPYRKSYRFRNFPSNIQKQLVESNHTLARNAERPFYIARMKDLGESFAIIGRTPTLLAKFQALSSDVLCQQILKLLHTIKQIKDSGYIHGDIRDDNVLCNLDTGELTIIDFDWFKPVSEFLDLFDAGYFYSLPPELAFLVKVSRLGLLYRVAKTPSDFEEKIDNVAGQLASQASRLPWIEGYVYRSMAAFKTLYSEIYETRRYESWKDGVAAMRQKFAETADLYSFGGALYDVFSLTEDTPLRRFIMTDLVPQMTDPDFHTRISVEQAISRVETYLGAGGSAIGGRRRHTNQKKRHRRTVKKTTTPTKGLLSWK